MTEPKLAPKNPLRVPREDTRALVQTFERNRTSTSGEKGGKFALIEQNTSLLAAIVRLSLGKHAAGQGLPMRRYRLPHPSRRRVPAVGQARFECSPAVQRTGPRDRQPSNPALVRVRRQTAGPYRPAGPQIRRDRPYVTDQRRRATNMPGRPDSTKNRGGQPGWRRWPGRLAPSASAAVASC